ncbi:MAG: two-component system phosphate regulon sensor histidine kinase PhoR [Cyclobacteriaceae bacterium]|jgi:two-component system phosphate regulon sensor histidine kinase PhoR
MRFRSRRFIILMIGTIVLPIIIYVVFSISKLKENEKVIEQIYKEQLDAIIFSINQYSNDILSAMIDDIDKGINTALFDQQDFGSLLSYSGVDGLYLRSLVSNETYITLYESDDTSLQTAILDSIYQANVATVDRLIGYLKSGYRKIEPVEGISGPNQLFYTIIKTEKEDFFLLTGLIDPGQYIPEILSPKLQQISGEELIVVFTNADNDNILFATDSLNHEVFLYEKMWMFNDIKVGISSKTTTVSDLVTERLRSNLIASGLLILLLITGLILIIRNIKHELKLAQKKSDFVSNVSHELRTPLALISMFAETLSLNRVKSEEQKKEYINIIYRETARLTNMVNRILNFSRIEANEREYQFSSFDVNELIKKLITDYAYHLEQQGFKYQLNFPHEAVMLNADHEAVYEAIVNLVDNAMKYSLDVKELTIALKADTDYVKISIQDKGQGIPKDKQGDIFDKFFRVTQDDLYTVKGTGLGLSIVKHIMDAHQGSIGVISEPNKGSTFTLNFINDEHTEHLNRRG